MLEKKGMIIVLILGLFFLTQNLESTWTTPKRLTWNSGTSWTPAIAIDTNNHIHVVWEDTTFWQDILYKKSTDGGETWSSIKRLTWNTPNNGNSMVPAIAIDPNNHIHVVWEHLVWVNNIPLNREIFYKQSTNGGATWSQKRLTWNSDDSCAPAIAVDSNNHIHLVWEDRTPGNPEIFYKQSTDGGATWSQKRLTWNYWGNSVFPDIVIDSNNHIHVVWEDNPKYEWPEIYYLKSSDGGGIWGRTRITWNSKASCFPTITTDSNNHIHVVWADFTPGNEEIFYKKSSDGGGIWTFKRLTWNSGHSYDQAIASDSIGGIHVVWTDETPGNCEIFYKQSTNGGATWTVLKRLTWNLTTSSSPAIAIDSDNHIHMVYTDGGDGGDIYYKKKE